MPLTLSITKVTALHWGSLFRDSRSPPACLCQRQIPSIIETLHSLPDEKLALEIETLLEGYSEPDRDQLLTSIYEETDLRPSFVRLPILLELARQDTGKIGLRATILAQLRSTLKEDHGHSWPDWALALTEHLANTEGFLPTEGSSYDQ